MATVAQEPRGFACEIVGDPARDTSLFPMHPDILANLFDRYPKSCPFHLREALGVPEEPRRFDTVLMGRRAYAPAVDLGLADGAYPHLRQIVVTHQDLRKSPAVEVMGGDIASQIAELKNQPGSDIWLCGGGDLAGQLVDLIDEIQVKFEPVLFGGGIPLFGGNTRPRARAGHWRRAIAGRRQPRHTPNLDTRPRYVCCVEAGELLCPFSMYMHDD